MRALQPGDPERLGDHELLGRLGHGGQGTVFLGRGPHGDVAVKLLHAQLSADPMARARFARELATLRRVAGFCTARVLAADLDGDRPYIVSEYVPGPSLRDLVAAEGPRSEGALMRLAVGTATALAAIHGAGIVHRDFKPPNVLMAADGPRVIDFGIARALDNVGMRTITGNLVGTPAYMAPEQFTDSSVGPAADLFSWAHTIVFAATGRHAFEAPTLTSLIHAIRTAPPNLTGIPPELLPPLQACLAKSPTARPTAQDLLWTLLTLPKPPPPTSPTPQPPSHPQPQPPQPAQSPQTPRPTQHQKPTQTAQLTPPKPPAHPTKPPPPAAQPTKPPPPAPPAARPTQPTAQTAQPSPPVAQTAQPAPPEPLTAQTAQDKQPTHHAQNPPPAAHAQKPQHPQRARDAQHVRAAQDEVGARSTRDAVGAQAARDTAGTRDARDAVGTRDAVGSQTARDKAGTQDARDAVGTRDEVGAQTARDAAGTRDGAGARDRAGAREAQDRAGGREARDAAGVREGLDGVSAQAARDAVGTRDEVGAQTARDAVGARDGAGALDGQDGVGAQTARDGVGVRDGVGGREGWEGVVRPVGAVRRGRSPVRVSAVDSTQDLGERRVVARHSAEHAEETPGEDTGEGGRPRLRRTWPLTLALIIVTAVSLLDMASLSVAAGGPVVELRQQWTLVLATTYTSLAVITLFGAVAAWRGYRSGVWTIIAVRLVRAGIWLATFGQVPPHTLTVILQTLSPTLVITLLLTALYLGRPKPP
ncbi:protein kinase domain-containing protein [Actinocorallia sp. A-T 12471]|uniref:protein kinase domain-containing protein n=1 Tax=Actinocorallia sp. A-T 12471 TaxID=3089813 RepID=UPI0029D1625E|nr:protein kinase [Actinocorallia sp. A-T 12471]MDX6739404.1 protein kinase [Actinocorallia sp. A-T 12471]